MKQIFTKSGDIVTEEVPAPVCGDNEVLVCNFNSLISAGTETMSLHSGGKGITGIASMALKNPELAHKAIEVGDRVACAGAGYASHAEIVSVPRNLFCKMPDNVDFDEAAFTTIGAIAMQGVRRAQWL
jgi:NADPH:quinone reductase-like Zn-dependent oxidoreductase